MYSLVLVAAIGLTQGKALNPDLFGEISHAPITELSGLIHSKRWDDIYWGHNDSGDSARLFALTKKGKVVMPSSQAGNYWVNEQKHKGRKEYPGVAIRNAKNVDWEDITTDGMNLYISDMGNNNNARKDLGVYVIPEPNPRIVMESAPAKFIPIRYPDQTSFPATPKQFDCESIFWLRGKLWFLTKHRLGSGQMPDPSTKLYVLDTMKTDSMKTDSMKTDSMNTLRKVDALGNLGGWVTAAAISPDSRTLAILTHFPQPSVWLISLPSSGENLLSGSKRQILLKKVGQCEALCFVDNNTMMVGNEKAGQLFKVPTQ